MNVSIRISGLTVEENEFTSEEIIYSVMTELLLFTHDVTKIQQDIDDGSLLYEADVDATVAEIPVP